MDLGIGDLFFFHLYAIDRYWPKANLERLSDCIRFFFGYGLRVLVSIQGT